MRGEFDRAMKELQEKFLAVKVEERYDPFTYVWDTVEHRFGDAIRAARGLTPHAAAERIVQRYFQIAGFGNERTIARIVGVDPELIKASARRLERQGLIQRDRRV